MDQPDEEEQLPDIKIDSFVLIKLHGKKTYRHYVGKIIEQHDDGDFSVSFMRRSEDGKFVFPNVVEEKCVIMEEIVTLLKPPHVSRGRFSFGDQLDVYQNLY